ncbi:uncharacterized protein LOC100118613 isoform X1 [Nasonia vitripennis]|uniref:Uncharacterized protein n=1 Tax=Nasonia vitripennis TaxID=7425 RepID=A0A7M7M2F4_NASVI|nr:uncharacterized protein LOC100118613 isoform X1 [Nasonia vitripennis]
MKISVIFIAVVVAAEASRPPRAFDSQYREFPPYIETPTPPSRPSFLRSFSRHESSSPTFYSRPQSFSDKESDIFSEGPPLRPPYREGRIFLADSPFSSSYFLSSRPESFHWEGPTDFREGQVITYEYKGPPPPLPTKDSRKQAKQPSGDPNSDHRATKPKEDQNNQQQEHRTMTETRQPLSFGGHSSHLSFGNHGLGFASVAGVTSADINPLAVAQLTAATKAAAATALRTSASTVSMQSSSTSGIEVSRQHPSTNPTSSEPPTSAAATSPSLKIAGAASSQAAQSTFNEVASTTPTMTTFKNPSATPNFNFDSSQITGHQINGATVKYYVSPKTVYDLRAIAQELPAPAHGLLPIESGKQQLQLSDIKQNLFFYDTRNSQPLSNEQLQQIQQQLNGQNSNSNVSPVRFSIPTSLIPTNPPGTGQMKLTYSPVDFARSPLSLPAVPNAYTSGQNHIDMTQLKLNPAGTSGPSNPSYYFIQPQEQAKPAAQIGSAIPLGSFYLLPNNLQAKQPIQQAMQVNPGISPGLQLQLSGFRGIEYLMAPSNPEQMRPAGIDAGKGIALQEQYRPAETMLTKIGFGQNIW